MPRRRTPRTTPSQAQLLFPLLEVLEAHGGRARPADVAEALADRYALSAETRTARVPAGAAHGDANQWKRTVRFVRERAKALGFVVGPTRNLWELTDAGRDGLRSARPGIVITVFETDRGVALWAKAESASQCLVAGSVNLIMTSPPYPLLRAKAYQRGEAHLAADAHVEWLLSLAQGWYDLLTDDGSLVLNLGPAFMPGQPTMSIYRHELYVRLVKELGFHLAGEGYWMSPSRLPAPAQWVTVKRVRVKNVMEDCFWFSKSPEPKADNRRVLTPYSDRMTALLARGGERAQRRPSGHVLGEGAFSRNNGGAIPSNVVTASHTTSNSAYLRHCRTHDLPIHPARFPKEVPEFWIKFLTEEQDLVYEPFGGSLTVPEVCDTLNRRWVASEMSLAYLAGGAARLQSAPGFLDHVGLPGLVPAAGG